MHCSNLAMAYAVELMQHFGIPEGIDRPALRSYLSPSMNDHGSGGRSQMRAPMHAATLMRLESLSDVPPLTVWGYVWYEMNLWMAVLLVLLCVYATVSAPERELKGVGSVLNALSRIRSFRRILGMAVGTSTHQLTSH